MKKRIKIKWGNILLLLIMIALTLLITRDIYLILVKHYSWTYFGFITFFGSIFTIDIIHELLFEEGE